MIVVAQGVLFPEALGWMGIWVFILYLIWMIVSIAVLRLSTSDPGDREVRRRALLTGMVTAAAAAGCQTTPQPGRFPLFVEDAISAFLQGFRYHQTDAVAADVDSSQAGHEIR